MILLDSREGSYKLALHKPIADLLPVCRECEGRGSLGTGPSRAEHKPCRGTGRQLATLASADVCVVGLGPGDRPLTFAIEVKTVEELLGSADTGRLQSQVYAMLEDDGYDSCWLLIYGIYRENAHTGLLETRTWDREHERWKWEPYAPGGKKPILYSKLRRMLMELSAHGVNYDCVPGTGASGLGAVARWIGDLYALWSKPYEDHGLLKAFDKSRRFPLPQKRNSRKHRCAEVANCFDELGIKRAMALAEHFGGSVRRMVNAGVDEWAEVTFQSAKGRRMRIGPSIAQAVQEQMD